MSQDQLRNQAMESKGRYQIIGIDNKYWIRNCGLNIDNKHALF